MNAIELVVFLACCGGIGYAAVFELLRRAELSPHFLTDGFVGYRGVGEERHGWMRELGCMLELRCLLYKILRGVKG